VLSYVLGHAAVAPYVQVGRLFRIDYNDVRMDVAAYNHIEYAMTHVARHLHGATLAECAAYLASRQIYSVRRKWTFLASEDCAAVYDPYFYEEGSEEDVEIDDY